MQDDFALLERARNLDSDALGSIHDLYYPAIYRYILVRVADRDLAEDLSSEVFLRFLHALRERKAPHSSLRGWLFSVAANLIADQQRKQYRAPHTTLTEALPSSAAGPGELLEAAQEREDLNRAVGSLTEEQQQVIAMRFGGGLPIQDVAQRMGKSEGAIKQLQARAIAALARKLLPGWVN